MTEGHGTLLGPDRIEELVAQAIDAKVNRRNEDALELLRVVVFEGNKVDALAFVVGCIVTIQRNLPPGVGVAATVPRPSRDRLDGGRVLFHLMLLDYLAGRRHQLSPRFFQADETAASCAIAAGVNAATTLIRANRARLQ